MKSQLLVQAKVRLAQLEAERQEAGRFYSLIQKTGGISDDVVRCSGNEKEIHILRAEVRAAELENSLIDQVLESAVMRGAIPPQSEEIKARYRDLMEADISNIDFVERLPGNPVLFSRVIEHPAQGRRA